MVSYHNLTLGIPWLLLPSDFTSLTISSLFGPSRSTGSSSLVSFLIACIKSCLWCSQETWTVKVSLQMFKCPLKINASDTDTSSSSPGRGLIYFFFLTRCFIANAHQDATLADLVLALKFPNGSFSFLQAAHWTKHNLLFLTILILSAARTYPKKPTNYVTYPLPLCDTNQIITLWLHIDFSFLLWDSHAADIHAQHKWSLISENANSLHLE